MFCKHLWTTYHPAKGRYQICDKCKKVIPIKCAHEFKVHTELKLYNYVDELVKYKMILVCKHCGIVRDTTIRV